MPAKGTEQTPEARARISAALRSYERTPEHNAKLAEAHRRNKTGRNYVHGPAEEALASALDRLGVAYKRQTKPLGGRWSHPVDFLMGGLVVEVDGLRHRPLDTWKKDRALDRQMIDAGYSVLRVENEIVLDDPDGCARIIAEAAAEVGQPPQPPRRRSVAEAARDPKRRAKISAALKGRRVGGAAIPTRSPEWRAAISAGLRQERRHP